jgi:hypothetical protein
MNSKILNYMLIQEHSVLWYWIILKSLYPIWLTCLSVVFYNTGKPLKILRHEINLSGLLHMINKSTGSSKWHVNSRYTVYEETFWSLKLYRIISLLPSVGLYFIRYPIPICLWKWRWTNISSKVWPFYLIEMLCFCITWDIPVLSKYHKHKEITAKRLKNRRSVSSSNCWGFTLQWDQHRLGFRELRTETKGIFYPSITNFSGSLQLRTWLQHAIITVIRYMEIMQQQQHNFIITNAMIMLTCHIQF